MTPECNSQHSTNDCSTPPQEMLGSSWDSKKMKEDSSKELIKEFQFDSPHSTKQDLIV